MARVESFPTRCLVVVVSGLLYACAYPPVGWGWLAWVGIAGLLAALRGLHGTRARALGLLFGLAAFGVGLSWLYQIFGVLVVVLVLIMAAFPAMFAHMQGRAVAHGVVGWRLAVFTALNWGGWEFIRAELYPLNFPWMTAGLAIGPNLLLPWAGVYAAGVAMVLAAALAVSGVWKSACAVLAVLGLAVGLNRQSPEPATEDPDVVKVAGIQRESVSLDVFLSETGKLPGDVGMVVWPEYGVPYDIHRDARDWKLVNDLCARRDITLTFGTQWHSDDNKEWRNIALTIDPSGTLGEHTKVHTVHFFNDGRKGNTALSVKTRHGNIGTPVCFDCDYEGVTRRMTSAGAEMFIVPIMDAVSWSARQHDQHAELFRVRACENGRWMFVCATSGVSQVIDPRGHVHARLAALEQGTLVHPIRRETGRTFFTRAGWLAPWIVLGIAAVGWLVLSLPVRDRRAA